MWRASYGLALGMSYTYELKNKTLGTIDPFVPDNRARNYTQNGRRPHNVIINYSYETPDVSESWHPVLRGVLNNWQISGVTQILSGTRQGFSYSYANVTTGALSGTGSVS